MSGGGGGGAEMSEEIEGWGGAAAAVQEWGGAAAAVQGWGGEESTLRALAVVERSAEVAPEMAAGSSLDKYNERLSKIIKSRHRHPEKFVKFFENILIGYRDQQALIEPEIDESEAFQRNLALPFGKQTELYQNIIEKSKAGRVEAVEINNASLYQGKTSNSVDFSAYSASAPPKIVKVRGIKKSVKININIEAAVYNAFNKEKVEDVEAHFKSKPEDFPIYLIGAFPELGRHLTIAVFFQGLIYSCGVASAGEGGVTGEEGNNAAMNIGSTSGGAAAAGSSVAGLAPPTAGFLGGASSGFATAGAKQRQITGSGSSLSGQAQIISPDWMFHITDTRIFDIGILRPEHIVRLKTYFDSMTEDVIMTFKAASRPDGFKGHVFDHYDFPLNARFAPLSSPFIAEHLKNYLNCTTFVLSIFKDIECPVRFAGSAIADPSECISKKYLTLKQVVPPGGTSQQIADLQAAIQRTLDSYHILKFQELYKGQKLFTRMKLWLLQQDPHSTIKYRDRDSYVALMLYRFIIFYINSGTLVDPGLFSELLRSYDKDAKATFADQTKHLPSLKPAADQLAIEEAETEARIAHMAKTEAHIANISTEGGRRQLRSQRKTCKRKSKARRQPRKRHTTKRQKPRRRPALRI